MTDLKLTKEQEVLFEAIESKLRQETVLSFIRGGYLNQTAAYLSACESLSKTPSKNPETSASEILSYPNVIDFMDSIKVKVARSVNIDAAWLLNELKLIHSLDIIDIMNDDLTAFKGLSEWPKIWRTSISGIDVMAINSGDNIEQIVKKIKWPDKVKNLEMIGRHVSVKAWDKEVQETKITNNIMPVPVADSIESWEESAQKQQDGILKRASE